MWFNQIALGGIVRVASIVNFLDCYRTPTSGNGRDVRRVDASGSLNYTYAYNNGGVSVVCNIF